MANKWTKDQESVIRHRNANLLVAAAAGSGKTAVLIERIIRLILDPVNPVDIDRLLVVTFTKAAAREMRERVGLAIEKELALDPDNTRLQRQRMLLNKADITTIDSFCNSVMRTNFHAIDLDPSVRIGDTAEIEILRNETIEEFFEKKYQEADEKFLTLVDTYNTRTNDNNLIDLVFTISNFVDSTPYPDLWLDEAAERFNPVSPNKDDYIDSMIIPQIEEASIGLNSLNLQLREVLRDLAEIPGYEKHYDFMADYRSKIEVMIQKMGEYLEYKNKASDPSSKVDEALGSIMNMLKTSYVNTSGIAPKIKKEYKEDYKTLKDTFDAIKKSVKSILDDLRIDKKVIERENELVYPHMRALSDLVREFRAYYKGKKLQKSIVEFSDVEHFALDILTSTDDDGRIVASDIARSYQERYQEIFTDEYQDSNLVQETILDMVSRKDIPNRFMVGDVKQSIYMFRQAMPEIFMGKYKTYDIYEDDVQTGSKDSVQTGSKDSSVQTGLKMESQPPSMRDRKILLYKNFRSRKEILEASNHVFKEIMTSKTGDIDYTDEERLNPGATFKENNIENSHVGGPVEVHILDTKDIDSKDLGQSLLDIKTKGLDEQDIEDIKDMEKFRFEAMEIANIIDDIVNPSPEKSRYMVYDNETDDYRPVKYKDIVVLFRSTKNRANILEDMLIKRDIPAYSESGGGYFSTIEVTTIINLLKVIDNPIQDIALIATMRSPIFNYTDQELARIRLADKESSYYQAIKTFIETSDDKDLVVKLTEFLDRLEKYRQDAFLLPIDQFMWKLYKDTGYYRYLEGLAMGEKRQANLILLHEKAKKYEAGSHKGLFNFLHYIERLKMTSSEPKEASLLSEDADLVRIMTIHKSKGLEFPIVIVANMDKNFNLRGDTSVVDLDHKLGYGPKYIDINKKIFYNTTAMTILKKAKQRAVKSEEMRMLYVAMTRAKEKLIFTGCLKDIDKNLEAWKNTYRDLDGNIDPGSILKSMTYMDWIMPTIVNLEKRQDCLDVRSCVAKYQGYKDCKWIIKFTDKYDVSKKYLDKLKDLEVIEMENLDSVEIKKTKYGKELIDHVELIDDKILIDHADLIDDKKLMSCEKSQDDKRPLDKDMINEILNFDYRFKSSASKPSSISVTDIKKLMAQEENDQMHDKLYKTIPSNDLKSPSFIHDSKSSASEPIKHDYKANERGTIFHLVMQLIDFKAFEDLVAYQQMSLDMIGLSNENDRPIREEIVRQIDSMVDKNILLRQEADTVNVSWIVRFIRSNIYLDILEADKRGDLYKETAINYNIKMKDIYKDQGIMDDESMMMVGIIDLFYENKDGDIILLDYKTDYVGDRSDQDLIDRYKVQLDLYKRAIEDISGKKVVKKYLYMFSAGRLLEC